MLDLKGGTGFQGHPYPYSSPTSDIPKMDIKQIVNSKGKGAAAVAIKNGSPQDIHLLHSMSQVSDIPLSEPGLERDNPSHNSENSRYSTSRYLSQMNGMNGAPTDLRYPSPTAMQNSMPMQQQPYRPEGFEKSMTPQAILKPEEGRQPETNVVQKAFPCSSCGKGFARRSDLARHERIHSGVRPHVCQHVDCGKQFIQRSALTVHMRVHTGEKPHMCERCGKPFSDSSSLARHRRIHSGKRPYKCPYADCQKTFTRRTTLTRHQNHHTGTVEEAAAATAAALATRGGTATRSEHLRSDGEPYSNNASPISTPSPAQRPLSASPNADLVPMHSNMHRHPVEYPYMNNSSIPGYLRSEYTMQSQSPAASSNFSNGMQSRPTSHPTSYGPPSILEPPTSNSGERQNNGSQSTSPHMGTVSWQSPAHNIPSPSASNGYVYPDPDPYGSGNMGQQVYYPNSSVRRPGSVEPEGFDVKPRMNEMWTTAQ
ncbi:hypothetical protein K3495_g2488 [Podosphaera aphanis]|nr:hypothetical protein K3495_g2488 [Podosphaera aphanis]